uniref:Protein adenylyltransferase Fic n=1 Tax=Culicoides sonorensis TaxID=179676 RepID=A0A336KTT5_CULSO
MKINNYLEKYTSMFEKSKTINLSFLFVFTSGALFSIFLFSLYNFILSLRKVQIDYRHHIPENNFLQLRDDVALIPMVFNDYALDNVLIDKTSSQHHKEVLDVTQNEQEALSSLKVALEMRSDGKDEKASRLFLHAIALAPKNPEILTKYGEFLEHKKQDVIAADEMYFRAIIADPKYTKAVENRKRTSHIVELMDLKRLARLDEKRDALSGVHETNAALRRAKKEAYIQHIYHSVGIEGNTMTLAQTRSILETKMAVDGKSIDEHNEIIGLDSAMKFINASLINKLDLITLSDILEIHKRVLGHVDPIEGGTFRETQVYVGGHIPPTPQNLRNLMSRFESWLNSEYAHSLHPVRHAALAHYKLVHIHPFTDGNGRTSRLLMNLILMRNGYPPIIIQKQQRFFNR